MKRETTSNFYRLFPKLYILAHNTMQNNKMLNQHGLKTKSSLLEKFLHKNQN